MKQAKLAAYHRKRDFKQTREPSGGSEKANSSPQGKAIFVVQKHAARRLHYDLRLEMEGVLKSWAVPKEPTMDPSVKRLAVHVEDHPLEYASFEGTIPKGNYGAGKVEIFDQGYYEPAEGRSASDLLKGLAKGSLKFVLHGQKLHGEFSLVRMKGEDASQWLLIKSADEAATNAASASTKPTSSSPSSTPSPMLAKLAPSLPEGEEWLYEKKYDGYRVLAVKDPVQLYSRNGNSLNKLFPSIVEALAQGDERPCTLDGEVVLEDSRGKPYFQGLAQGEPVPRHLHLRYYVFDLLALDGHDLTEFTLEERRELLELLLAKWPDASPIRLAEQLTGSADRLWKQVTADHSEGLLAKRRESRYLAGRRSESWVKVKARRSQEAVICGFTQPQGSRAGLGALVLGIPDHSGLPGSSPASPKWRYLGNCGTGFTDDTLLELREQLDKITRKTKPFPPDTAVSREAEVTWVTPQLVCEVYYAEWTRDRHFRHPVFKGLRQDKKAREVTLEESSTTTAVKTTNRQILYWPDEGYTKGHMLEHYELFGERMLPFMKDAPLSLHRFPNGIKKPGFYQKDMDVDQVPDWIQTVPILSESTGKAVDYVIGGDLATLLYVANLGSIEINPWLSTYHEAKRNHPVFGVLDLDPNDAAMDDLVEVAQTAHQLFQQAGLADFVKTSGSTGLHIYLFVNQQYTYDMVRDFIQLIAEMVHEEHPDTTSLVRDPRKRRGKIYLDYLQNRRGQTVVAPYSLRPKPLAPVSTPLQWDEVKPGLTIDAYNIQSIRERMHEAHDPWRHFFHQPADLQQALKAF